METSIFIAKIIGVIYLSFGIGLLFNKDYYSKVIENLLDNSTYMILGGVMAIVFGFLILENHHHWVKNWTVLITIIGWIALIKGVLLLALPKTLNIFKPLLKTESLNKSLAPLVIIFGIVFIYLGFFS